MATFISDSPFMSIGAPTATSIASMILTTSPRASSKFLPSSVETRVAISSILARSIGRHVKSTSVRFWTGKLAHGPKARWALSMASVTSASVHIGVRAITSPVLESVMSTQVSLLDSRHSPSTM